MSEKLDPESNHLKEIFQKYSLVSIKSGEKIPSVYERVFSASTSEGFTDKANAEYRAKNLVPGLHVEIGFGYDPFIKHRTFSEISPYLGIDGGSSEHASGKNVGWLDYKEDPGRITQTISSFNTQYADRPDKDFIHFIVADAKRMPLPDDSVREVYMNNVFLAPGILIPDAYSMVSEIYRVLQPEGLLILSDSERHAKNREAHNVSSISNNLGFLELGVIIEAAGFSQQALDEDENIIYARKTSIEQSDRNDDTKRSFLKAIFRR